MSKPEPALLVDRLREVHVRMVDAVLGGDGMREVAAIAAARTHAAVAVIAPGLGHELVEPDTDENRAAVAEIRSYVLDLIAGREAEPPPRLALESAIRSGGTRLGAVLLVGTVAVADEEEVAGVLHMAAMAAITESALTEGRQQVQDELRGTFLEELRDGSDAQVADLVRRAGRLGCDISRGALVLAAEPKPDHAHRLMAAIKSDLPLAFVQRLQGRVYAVVPPTEHSDGAERVTAAAAALARRLRSQGPLGVSSFYTNPGELGRAFQEAELVLDVLGQADLPPESLHDGAYRLLMQLLVSHPGELDAYHERTIAPIANYDEQYRTQLLETLAAYLDHDCNMNATASALYAHRHTVAYRLERIRELTGLDLGKQEHRERLGLGLKVHTLIRAPARAQLRDESRRSEEI